MRRNTSRRSCHGLVWLTAGLWLLLEAWTMLDATFHLPVLRTLAGHLHLTPHVVTWLRYVETTSWPVVSVIMLLIVREEAIRWFTGHATCRIADRLTTAWFVFVATLFIVDRLTPAITVVWTVGALGTTVWFVLARVTSMTSRVLHATLTRRLRRVVRRWPVVHVLSTVAEYIPRLRPPKGVLHHVPHPHVR